MDGKKILVVDGEQSIRTFVKKFLSRYYTVFEAENGEVAIDIAKREKPHLILMDVRMPKMDGYTACAKIKGNQATKGITIIIMTSFANERNGKLAQDVGANGCIAKPINLQELLKTVERFLGSAH